MGTKSVRLDEDVYERVKDKKRDDETFSEAIDRLIGDYTLVDFANDRADVEGPTLEERREDWERMEEADRKDRKEREQNR